MKLNHFAHNQTDGSLHVSDLCLKHECKKRIVQCSFAPKISTTHFRLYTYGLVRKKNHVCYLQLPGLN